MEPRDPHDVFGRDPFEDAEAATTPTGSHRLHPMSPVFEIGRSFFSLVVPGLVFVLLASGDSYELWYMLLFVPAAAVSLKRYLTLRYELSDDHLVVREGLVFRSVRHIPYDRIQNIDTVQNPLHRLLGVVEVRVETASGQEPEAVLRVLSVPRFMELRAGVFAERDDDEAQTPDDFVGPRAPRLPEPQPVPFFRMRPVDVVYFGLLSQKGIAVLSGLVFLLWEFNLWDRIEKRIPIDPERLSALFPAWEWLVIGVFIVALLQVVTVAWAFITLHDFHIVRSKDDLRTTCGLWTHQTATLPRHRIQFLSISEGLFPRLFGRISVKALTAGGDSTNDSQVSRKWLVPLVERAALDPIVREIQPDVAFTGLPWARVHPHARRRMIVKGAVVALVPTLLVARDAGFWAVPFFALLVLLVFVTATKRARRLAYAVTDSAVYVRDGVLTHARNAVRFSKIQSISLRQTPFDRRHRMATVSVDTAGPGGSDLTFRIPYLDVRDAMRFVRTVRRRVERTSFRW